MTDPPNEDPGRVEAELSPDEAVPLDALVGGFEDIRTDARIAEDPAVFRPQVFVRGVEDAAGMGLADDVRMLLDAFVREPASVDRETSAETRAAVAGPGEDVEIALHGLNLGPEDERLLHRLIRNLVAGRRAPGEPER